MTETLQSRYLDFEHNFDEWGELIEEVPGELCWQMRGFVGASFGRWNNEMKANMPKWASKLQKRGAFTWYAFPRTKAIARRQKLLREIRGHFRSTSVVVTAHEFAPTTILPGAGKKYLTVPVGKLRRMSADKRRAWRLDSVRAYQRAVGDLVPVKSRKGGKSGIVLKRPTGQLTPKGKVRMETLFVLKRSVTLTKSLGMFATWDRLQRYRDEKLEEAISNTYKALEERRIKKSGG